MQCPIAINASLSASCIQCANDAGLGTNPQWSSTTGMILISGENGVLIPEGNEYLVIVNAADFLSLQISTTIRLFISCGIIVQSVSEAGV